MRKTKEECFSVASKYKSKQAFRIGADSHHQWLRRNGLLGQACAHMAPLRRNLSNDDICEIARNYQTRRAFKLGDQSAYLRAHERGIIDSVCAHMELKHRMLSDDEIAKIAKQFSSKVEFLKGDQAAYQAAEKRGILDKVCSPLKSRDIRRLSDDEIKDIAKKYPTRIDFKFGDFGAYVSALKRGFIDEACSHMERGEFGFNPEKSSTLYSIRVTTAEGRILYKVGITNRSVERRINGMGLFAGVSAEVIDETAFPSGRDARIAEKRLHRRASNFKYIGPPVMNNGNTELFTENVFNL